ncbi:replication restart helicase PriA [Rickettsiales endosymbiont of Stachyamoeba lipophora]|uniref:replication restart helicase PriA n=1 Tax=Rickettsiales endosymbiont of Stachyamoeba lipophora TaxID=2486578 RepID=UPI000F65173D|nr:primosomal protein N' [Rickettsiales endosymbiont of Stachyamoeba lipophora]
MLTKEIILPLNFDHGFDYLENDFALQLGDLVQVNFKGNEVIGVVKHNGQSNLPASKLKPVIQKLGLLLSPTLIKFLDQVSNYNLAPIGEAYRMAIGQINNKAINLCNELPIVEYNPNLPPLRYEQQQVYEAIINSKHSAHLLHGVTGAGKTEVYFWLINYHLKQHQQVLLLMPEIALTTQIVKRFAERFGTYPTTWHSSMTPKQKQIALSQIISGKTKVIIGARSSLFLPFKNLGLIIVDEEHDQSYKQDDIVCYHGRNMAVLRGHIEQIKVVLGSATPSIESIVNSNSGKYLYHKITANFGTQSPTEISAIDLTKNKLKSGEFISSILAQAIRENYNQKNQTLLFLNRRGYAPLLICNSCGFRVACPDCTSWLVTHHKLNKLVCHHCGFNKALINNCQNCGDQNSLVACGPGVERIEQEVKQKFPEANICNINTDSVTTPKQVEQLFHAIMNNEYDIIIGTQMIGKGLDFPKLTLVGVIDADLGVGGDLRASERTFQIINQVLGRAGRHLPGKALIQTYNITNSVIQAILTNQSDKFIESEINSRHTNSMPPFARMAAIVISSLNEEALKKFAQEMSNKAPYVKDITVFGPAPAILYKIKNRFRIRFLVQASVKTNIQNYLKAWLQNLTKPANIRLKVDIDPYSFV